MLKSKSIYGFIRVERDTEKETGFNLFQRPIQNFYILPAE